MRPFSDVVRAVAGGAVLMAALATPARAEDRPACSDQPDLGRPVSLARVVAEGRVPFLKSGDANAACPSLAPACRERAYLVAGNLVIRGAVRESFVCAIYVGATGETRSGWLPASALADDEPAKTSLDDWTGTWTSGPEQTVTIRRNSGALTLSGEASYGSRDPDRVKRGAVNTGSFTVAVHPEGRDLAFTDRDDRGVVPVYSPDDISFCSVRMRLLPPYLIAESNTACGGMNVSFGGIYRR